MNNNTITFSIGDQTEQEIRNILLTVYDALKENGYSVNLTACGRCGKKIEDKVFLSVKKSVISIFALNILS